MTVKSIVTIHRCAPGLEIAARGCWWLALLALGGWLLTGCGGPQIDQPPVPPATPPSTPEAIAPPPEPTPTPQPTATLPDALVQQWEPMSNVLLTFGPMQITKGEVQWGSGQTSPYTLVSSEGGFLLKLESGPKFYDTANPYIKLMPKPNEAGVVTELEVAFYENEAQARKNEYIMYGSYFVN